MLPSVTDPAAQSVCAQVREEAPCCTELAIWLPAVLQLLNLTRSHKVYIHPRSNLFRVGIYTDSACYWVRVQ